MALVEIADFLDPTEAQAAAAALRASGVPVLLQNEHIGQIAPLYQFAVGGFRLWAPEEDADDARAFIAASRGPPEPRSMSLPAVTLGVVALATWAGVLGWLVAPILKRRRALPDDA